MLLDVEKVERFRKQHGISKSDFSNMLGYAYQSGYSNLLRDKYVPRDEILKKLAAILGCKERSLII